jgi:IS1 family transposase
VVDTAINGSGILDTARVLRLSPTTVIAVLKKPSLSDTPTPCALSPPRSHTDCAPAGRAAEMDEMWSFVGTEETPRWLWHALDHHTGKVLAYVVGSRKDVVVLKLRALLAPCGITHYYTDKASIYQRHLTPEGTIAKLIVTVCSLHLVVFLRSSVSLDGIVRKLCDSPDFAGVPAGTGKLRRDRRPLTLGGP